MTSHAHTAVVAGATGLIGGELVRQLLAAPGYSRIIVLARRRTGLSDARLDERVIDFDRFAEETAGLLTGADVFCALGTTIRQAGSQEAFRRVDYTYPLELGKAAARDGARQLLIVTSMGADAGSSIFYNRVKGETEAALRELQLPALGIFRPSLLLGDRSELRLGERIGAVLSRGLAPLMRGSLARYRPIEGRQVARAMIRTAGDPRPGTTVYESDRIAELSR